MEFNLNSKKICCIKGSSFSKENSVVNFRLIDPIKNLGHYLLHYHSLIGFALLFCRLNKFSSFVRAY